MAGFITKYVEGCDKCQRYRKDIHPTAQIHPQEIQKGPWQLIGVDLIGPLPMSKGKDMILNVVDHYTKQVHLFPVTSQITADGVAGIYFDFVFPLHGIPRKVISDRGPQFAARSMCALYKQLSIDTVLRFSLAHPRKPHRATTQQRQMTSKDAHVILHVTVTGLKMKLGPW